jgi:hypothetical protein
MEAQIVTKRPALILCSKTIADCPLDAVCISIDEETKRKTICGHYAGSVTTITGSQVNCQYVE